MSYLQIPLSPAINGQTSFQLQKKDIVRVITGDGVVPPTAGTVTTTTTIYVNSGVAALDQFTLTHTAPAAGSNVADIINENLASNPGGIVARVGGIPATLSVTAPGVIGGQALTFVQFSAVAIS
tara:strand:- start:14 stop:385 length:372 start_codon:yes stop_codon:yes gene_type:complete